ncbi:MAG: phage holin family protein [Pseudomonadota bacterium]
MIGILIRVAIIALGLWLAATIVPGVEINSRRTLLLAALLMGVVNALVRPVALLLTLPLTILTLGLFMLVVNAAMFGLVAWFLDGFYVSGFFAALFGWLIVSITSTVASWYIGPDGRYEVMVIQRRR